MDPANNNYTDVLSIVFRNIDPSTLSLCNTVNKEWNHLITPDVWREVIGKCFALGVSAYKSYFNHDVKNIELPMNIHKEIMDLYKFSTVHGLKKAPILTLIDPNLTLKKIGEFVKPYLQNSYTGYLLIQNLAEEYEKLDNGLCKKPYWALMMNGVIAKNLNYDNQKAFVEDLKKDNLSIYQFPATIEAVTCIYLKLVVTNTCEFSIGYTRTQNMFREKNIVVGGLQAQGLLVFHTLNSEFTDTGVAILKKL